MMNFRTGISLFSSMVLIAGVAFGKPEPGSQVDQESSLLTAAVALTGWEFEAEPQRVVGEALFELINGGAELYHRFGFVQAVSAQYADPDDRSISLEIFEMKNEEGAHRIFVEKSGGTGQGIAIGDESAAESYYLNYRTGIFLVTITGFDSDPVTSEALLSLARAVESKLGEIK